MKVFILFISPSKRSYCQLFSCWSAFPYCLHMPSFTLCSKVSICTCLSLSVSLCLCLSLSKAFCLVCNVLYNTRTSISVNLLTSDCKYCSSESVQGVFSIVGKYFLKRSISINARLWKHSKCKYNFYMNIWNTSIKYSFEILYKKYYLKTKYKILRSESLPPWSFTNECHNELGGGVVKLIGFYCPMKRLNYTVSQ